MSVTLCPTITDAERCLHEVFGYRGFRPGQAEVIEAVLARRDTLAIMPTGAGKSLCYQIPAVLLPHTTLVISPLIALMKDQVDSLLSEGRARAGYLNSSVESGERRRILRRLVDGWYDLLYVAPERLRSRSFLAALRSAPIGLLVVDEAHCISEWGHDFRPDYLHIPDAFPGETRPPVLAATATATRKVQDDILRQLRMADTPVLELSVDRPNLSFSVRSTPTISAKLNAMQELLPREPGSSAIIYCGTRAQTEEVAEFVRSVMRMPCAAYHAGLGGLERTRVQDDFMTDRVPVVAATTAFGMGIDKENIRCVLHFTMPDSVEAYYQQAGRAGRDGEPARCALLYAADDRSLLEYFATSSFIRSNELLGLWDAVRRDGSEAAEGSLEVLVSTSGLGGITGLPEQKVTRGIELLCSFGPLQRLPAVGGALRFLVTADRLEQQVISEIMDHVENTFRVRRQQLNAMVDYAESEDCRRKCLVGHFGQEPQGQPDDCCDSCAAGALEGRPTSREGLAVLRCVGGMRSNVGRQMTVEILAGANTQKVRNLRLHRLEAYGALRSMRQTAILHTIDTLIAEGLLRQKGSDRPVLALTPSGRRVLAAGEVSPEPMEMPAAKPSPAALGAPAPARPEAATIRSAILACLGELPYRLGRTRIAEILTGSAARHIVDDGLSELPSYGTCRGIERECVLQEIDGLVAQGVLRLQGHLRPVVVPALPKQAPAAAPSAAPTPAAAGAPDDEPPATIERFLARPHPQRLRLEHVDLAYSLDANSRFRGETWQRTRLGEMLFALKYRERLETAKEIAGEIMGFIRSHPDIEAPDAVIGVPPTEARGSADPVSSIVSCMAEAGIVALSGVLQRSRTTARQKGLETAVGKRRNVHDAFTVAQPELVAGRRLLLLDDFVDSGATLNECARVLKAAGAAAVNALAVTRTIHHAG